LDDWVGCGVSWLVACCSTGELAGSGGRDLEVSAVSKGVVVLPFVTGGRVLSIDIPFIPLRGAGVVFRDDRLLPSPSLTSSSTALSMLPFKPLSMARFFFSSGKPISLSCNNFIL